MNDEVLTLSPFFELDLGPPIRCTLLSSGETWILPGVAHVRLLAQLRASRTRPAAIALASAALRSDRATATKAVDDLLQRGILVQDADDPRSRNVHHWVGRNWLDALILHTRTRDLRFAEESVPRSEVMATLTRAEKVPAFWSNREGPTIPLSTPSALPTPVTVLQTMKRRRTHKRWSGSSLPETRLSTILFHANALGVRLRKHAEAAWRREPASLLDSSFCALETHVLATSVAGVPPGMYAYDPQAHQLVETRAGAVDDQLLSLCKGQRFIRGASCAFLLTAVWRRYMYRYRHPRAYRTLLINTSELAQRYIFLATAHGLTTFPTPALDDALAESLLGTSCLDEGALYVVGIG